MSLSQNNFTIVIVTFKSEKVIETCLNSINQKYTIIIVENSNNENFKKNIEGKFPNVQCYLTGSNIGMGSANNIGIKFWNFTFFDNFSKTFVFIRYVNKNFIWFLRLL